MRVRAITVAISALAGVGLGAVSGQILFGGSIWNLIPWGIFAIVIGLVAKDLGTAALASGVSGYLLVAFFLFVANGGDVTLGQRALFALTLGLVGPLCSIPLSLLAHFVLVRARRRSER